VGIVGEVHPTVIESFEIERGPVAIFELDIEGLLKIISQEGHRYRPVGRFPSATRDLSIQVDRDIPAAKVQEIIARQRLVTRVQLFDVYTGENIAAGKRSLAYHIYFQAADKTLTADEVNRAYQSVLNSLEREIGAEPRG
jgi:phenylalanyl-tRNA synthetase beta chain